MHKSVRHKCNNSTIILLLAILLLATCTSRMVVMPVDRPVPLATETASCSTVSSDGQWQAVWDMYRLFDADFSEFQFKPGASYRYVMEDDWKDWLTNVTVGFLTTVTRHTVLLQVCNQQLVLRTQEEMRSSVEDALAKHLKDEGTTRENKRQPIFILTDGSSVQGRLVIIEKDTFTVEIEALESEDSDSDKPAEEVIGDWVQMRNGENVKGHVRNQNTTSITIEITMGDDKGKTKTISKSEIAQVQFNVPLNRDVVKRKTMVIERDKVESIKVPQ